MRIVSLLLVAVVMCGCGGEPDEDSLQADPQGKDSIGNDAAVLNRDDSEVGLQSSSGTSGDTQDLNGQEVDAQVPQSPFKSAAELTGRETEAVRKLVTLIYADAFPPNRDSSQKLTESVMLRPDGAVNSVMLTSNYLKVTEADVTGKLKPLLSEYHVDFVADGDVPSTLTIRDYEINYVPPLTESYNVPTRFTIVPLTVEIASEEL